jgi:conjugal transfer pilus assembly protein TraD
VERPLSPAQHSSSVRRYLSVAFFLAVLMSPSAGVAAGLLAAGAALAMGPALRSLWARRSARAREQPAGRGMTLGIDPARRPVTLSDGQLAAHTLIVGASGAGKSTTMLGLLGAEVRLGRPVVAIDMKGSPAFADELRRAAKSAGRGLRIWTLDGPSHWNPLAHGNATALKDMLISTERFSEPHYQRAAERYVQTALQVLHASHPGRPTQLDEVVAVMEPRRLASMLRRVPTPLAHRVQDYLAGLTPDQVSAARGMGTRLALLSESSAGPYLSTGGAAPGAVVDLRAGLEGGDVILFSLNSMVYGKLAAQLGALAIQDLVAASGHRLDPEGGATGPARVPATVGIDEFSALGADNVLALLARGREPGVRVVVATQEMADLERAGRGFRDQVLGIVGIKLIHRQDVPDSALMVAKMAGTEWVWDETRHVRSAFASRGGVRATRRQVERFVVHPNEITTLAPGRAVLLTKLPTAAIQRVAVRAPSAGRSGPSSDRRGPSDDRSGPSPGRSGPSPGRSGPSPGRSGPSPGRSRASTDRSRPSDDRNGSSAGRD